MIPTHNCGSYGCEICHAFTKLEEINRKLAANMTMVRNEDDRIIALRTKERDEYKACKQYWYDKCQAIIEFVEYDVFYDLTDTLLHEKEYPKWVELIK